eukprot:1156174-Pelagomonas_calceolata.AAC.4
MLSSARNLTTSNSRSGSTASSTNATYFPNYASKTAYWSNKEASGHTSNIERQVPKYALIKDAPWPHCARLGSRTSAFSHKDLSPSTTYGMPEAVSCFFSRNACKFERTSTGWM